MKRLCLAWILTVLLFSGMTFGQVSSQNIFPFKDMVFPQVAAGGGYESWITITNRGPRPWYGDLKFYKGKGLPWNPVVDGIPVVGGTLRISAVNPKETQTRKVTLSGSTEAGYAVLVADDLVLTNFLEGYLTYYISEEGKVTDSVGVLPARQFMVASLPFEDFNSICLGVVNSDPEGRTAHLKGILYDGSGSLKWTKEFQLEEGEYSAQYLSQLAPEGSTPPVRGRFDIESDVPISGVALTQAPGNQFSSLPFESTTRTYTLAPRDGQMDFYDHLTLWTESLFVKGYLEILIEDEWQLFAVSGKISNGELHFSSEDYGTDLHPWFYGFARSDGAVTLGQQSFTLIFYGTHPTLDAIEGASAYTATLVK
jgi:hypothetical protein